LGRLYALSVVAAAHVRAGDTRPWLSVLRASVADPDFPEVYSIQSRSELARVEAIAATTTSDRAPVAEAPDLDATIARLLTQEYPSPVA
jgi:hypothetical protein